MRFYSHQKLWNIEPIWKYIDYQISTIHLRYNGRIPVYHARSQRTISLRIKDDLHTMDTPSVDTLMGNIASTCVSFIDGLPKDNSDLALLRWID